MRILFKTSYRDDIRLFPHSGYVIWYGILGACLLLAPLVLREFYVGELLQVFILALAGVGLMLLIGYTGLASLGHGAFLAIGGYVNAYPDHARACHSSSASRWRGWRRWRPASPWRCPPTA